MPRISATSRPASSLSPPSRAPVRRVAAVACAVGQANAVGVVRLGVGREALEIELCRVGRFEAGFVMPSLGQAVRLQVPFNAVRGLTRRGPHLLLSLDPRVASPFNRFALARFSFGAPGALWMRAWGGRTVRALSWLVPPALGGAVLALVPRSLASGPVGLGAAALVTVLAAFVLLRRLADALTWGGPVSALLGRRFERELAGRLGLEPLALEPSSLDFVPEAADIATPERPASALWHLLGSTVRHGALVAAVLGIGGAIALSVALDRYGVVRTVELPVAPAERGLFAGLPELTAVAGAALVPSHAGCRCERPDSPLWRSGLPQLSLLAIPRRGEFGAFGSADDGGPWLEPGADVKVKVVTPPPAPQPPGKRRRRTRAPRLPQLELEIAAVNNGATALAPVTAVLTFARRNEQGQRVGFVERGMYWPKLGPGEAVKWRIKGEGTEFRIETPLRAAAARGALVPATAAKFVTLGAAKLPEVRLHAALMLSYLGDAHAGEVLAHLGDDGRYRALGDELTRARQPLAVCDVRVGANFWRTCLANGTPGLVRGVTLREIGGALRTWTVEDLFYAGRGLDLELPLGDGGPPAEVIAEAIVP